MIYVLAVLIHVVQRVLALFSADRAIAVCTQTLGTYGQTICVYLPTQLQACTRTLSLVGALRGQKNHRFVLEMRSRHGE